MSRDINGVYTLPIGNPVIPGTIIEDAWANPTMTDLANALTDSLSRSGLGGMLVPFKNTDGTRVAPGITWINEPTSGWYRKALNEFWYSVGDEDIFQIIKTGIAIPTGKTFMLGVNAAGYLNVPSNPQIVNYTTVLADSGVSIDHPATDANARTYTIAANASVSYAVGTVIAFSNMTVQAVTLAIAGTDILYLAGPGTVGNRSLAQFGVAVARKLTATTWLISGTGLT